MFPFVNDLFMWLGRNHYKKIYCNYKKIILKNYRKHIISSIYHTPIRTEI